MGGAILSKSLIQFLLMGELCSLPVIYLGPNYGGVSEDWKVPCMGNWNVRSMNQGKLKTVKQEMARVNIDILGISELKWTGMGELLQMTIISIAVGKNPLEEME